MRIYTRKGDTGRTSLWGGRRVGKDELRIEAIGSVDECNAAIGVALAHGVPEPVAVVLRTVQDTLFVVGSELMAPDRSGPGASVPRLSGQETRHLEQVIDELEAGLPPLRNFVLPGGGIAAAHLHLARTVCRRAERRATALSRAEEVGAEVLTYLNRLADLLFVVARHVNHVAGVVDVPWRNPAR
ncbi:ATP:cob(I)alamin adenosyltransferase [Streptoalloteichus tenebrarius]|uniref:Corrinoid adenosyltransferase n=1 Tax=Streptoalloteichus tenebrarius (strain ATCC 17920 / DSM 40477 / JCM 4838 / CBS 697.72 / NBRC 16177 / NCIMB 11028 / NRRL B-12390 / A12253. 1 / ISP 5477) TaxID=1933 RepID=A0ABT1HYV7_STRSD|nr:cob(I)yrinic acid a,c-diamide adenosyltransferase [Streptoalloteichus tenebrarius]MCP2260704.1 ATP:cob(I)alamin adenosyltransferase [Streptoalloteichus tenebrarius]BFF03763.1 cob(I)yrinic acid a,c-diamide adenosyltransferase [Streptoalloteichus tenebrarius]